MLKRVLKNILYQLSICVEIYEVVQVDLVNTE